MPEEASRHAVCTYEFGCVCVRGLKEFFLLLRWVAVWCLTQDCYFTKLDVGNLLFIQRYFKSLVVHETQKTGDLGTRLSGSKFQSNHLWEQTSVNNEVFSYFWYANNTHCSGSPWALNKKAWRKCLTNSQEEINGKRVLKLIKLILWRQTPNRAEPLELALCLLKVYSCSYWSLGMSRVPKGACLFLMVPSVDWKETIIFPSTIDSPRFRNLNP